MRASEGELDASNPFDEGACSDETLKRELPGGEHAARRYRIDGELARGGMGAILEVWDRDLRRKLAMKVSLFTTGDASEESSERPSSTTLARFFEEAQITGQLDHPGIVPVHELGLDSRGHLFFTMRLVRGRDLRQIFALARREEDGWSRTRALGVMLKVCETMAFAHSKGVIHRDLKPSNVMVGRFGEVYVMDWGLAKVQGREDRHDLRLVESMSLVRTNRQVGEDEHDSPLITMDGAVIGTPTYMPPEQARGELESLSSRSDVYSIGTMLYQLLAGHAPYVQPGTRVSPHTVLAMVLLGPPRPIRELVVDVPPELEAICEKAMARDPAARYADTSELADDLRAYLEGRVVHAYEGGAWAEARKWIQRNKPLAAALAVGILFAIGGLGAVARVQAMGRRAAENERKVAEIERKRADDKTREAEQNAARAQAETTQLLRVSDLRRLQQLGAEADALWPPHPDRIPAFVTWMESARELVSRHAGDVALLAETRGRALPYAQEDRVGDQKTYPRAHRLANEKAELEKLLSQLEAGLLGQALDEPTAVARIAELEPDIEQLEREASERRTWRFETAEDQRQHDVLTELVAGMRELETGLLAQDAIHAVHGWSLPKRIVFARRLEQGFAPGGEYAARWAEALPAIRTAYPGLELAAQMGLFPIGPDPRSGLWEFLHLMSGEEPVRDADGRLIATEDTGVVLVLLGGRSFWMGAQQTDPVGRNYDPLSIRRESSVHEVTLSHYFLSKDELTQGQYLRLTGRNPSLFTPRLWGAWLESKAMVSLAHPLEAVTWEDLMIWLPRAGLALPTEAQWEYGARGGTDTPWWTGVDQESLQGAANLSDSFAMRNGGIHGKVFEMWLDDGATVHAPVGSFAANPFGLRDVHGSVNELCLDGLDNRFYDRSPSVDPVATWQGAATRVFRGGSSADPAIMARSAYRNGMPPAQIGEYTGVRPARAVEP